MKPLPAAAAALLLFVAANFTIFGPKNRYARIVAVGGCSFADKNESFHNKRALESVPSDQIMLDRIG